MKRNKIILGILILSTIVLVFSGCGTTPSITQNGSISGRIMVPDNFKKDTEGWNYPLTDANVDTTDSKGKKHITTTDNDGYYTIFDVAPGYNYIITAEGTKKGSTIFIKDVAEQVKEGENYDAGVADAESTTVALVLENIMEDPEVEIENINADDIENCENFNEALSIVSNTINSGENIITSSAVSASIEAVDVNSIIEPQPQEKKAGIMGRLIDGITDYPIANGYVFVIDSNGDILDHTITLDAGAGPDSGHWQFTGLPFGEKVTIVGFHPEYKFNMAMGDFDLDVQFKDIGRFETFCAINEDFTQEGAGVSIGLTSLALTVFQNIAATALNNQAIVLASYLLFEIGYYDEFEIIAGNIYNVSPLPEFFELGKEYSTDVFVQNTGDKEIIYKIIPSHEVVDKEKNRSKVTSGINFDPEYRLITLKPVQSGSRNFKFILDTFKSDRIITFSLYSYRDYTSDWELVGEDYKIPLSFNESDLPEPTGVSASDGTYNNKVALSCVSVTGATHYQFYRATSSGGTKTALGSWQTGRIYDDFDASPAVTYYYFARAATSSSGDNASPYSTYNTGWKALIPPQNVSATDGLYPDKVRITWNSVPGASYYRVYRATSSTGTKTALGSWQTGTTYYDYSTGTYYYFVTAATNSSGLRESEYSTGNSGNTGGIPATYVTASDGTYNNKVALSCVSVTGATHYQFYRATSSGGTKTALGSWQTGRTYDDFDASPAVTYYYFARAATSSSGDNASPYSTYNTGWKALIPPQNVSATDGLYPDKVRITWNSVPGASYYRVYRATSSTGTKTALGSWQTGTTYYDYSTGTYYYFVTAATNSSGLRESEYSTGNSGNTGGIPATYVTASDGTYNNKVALSCVSVTGATHYQFYRATSSGGTKTALGSWQTGRTYDDFDASPAVTYYYFARAATSSSGDNASPYSTYNTGWKALIPPQNVSATDGLYPDKVRITWNSVPGASYYRVYRATSSTGTKTALGSWQTGTTYYDYSTGTYYYFVTAATNSSGLRESEYSTGNSGNTGGIPATYVTASDGTYNNKVALSCVSVTGATHYQFYRATSSGGTKTALGSWQTGRIYDDFDASPAVTYYYFARAATSSSGDNASPYSTYNTGWKALIPPQNVSATDGLYPDKVRITWNSVPGASYYRVYRATSSTGTKTALGSWQTGTTYYDYSTGTYYYFVTAATNSSGLRESEYSTGNSGNTGGIPATYVTASDGTYNNKVALSCVSVTGATHYQFYRATSSGGTKTALGSWQTGRIYDDFDASPAVTYYYFARAATSSSGDNASPYSTYNTGWKALIPPQNVSATDGLYPDKVRITWNSVPGASYYRVYRATSSTGTKTALGSWQTGTTYYDYSTGTYYYFVTAATNSSGLRESEYSTGNSGNTGGIPATYVTASDGTYNNKVALSCVSVTGATHYQFYRATSSGGTKTALGSWQTGRIYDDFDASPAVTYYYFARAATSSSGDNASPYSTYNTGWKALIPPQNVSATDGLYPDKVRITWNSVPGASYYRVYRATSSTGTKTALGSWQTGTTYYDYSTGTYYYFVTAATNSSGLRESEYSTGNSGNTSTVYGSITVTAVDSSNNPVSGNDWGFVLFKNGSYVKEVGGQTHTYTFTNLLAGTYKIDVYDYATYKNSKDNIILGDGESKSVKITVQ